MIYICGSQNVIQSFVTPTFNTIQIGCEKKNIFRDLKIYFLLNPTRCVFMRKTTTTTKEGQFSFLFSFSINHLPLFFLSIFVLFLSTIIIFVEKFFFPQFHRFFDFIFYDYLHHLKVIIVDATVIDHNHIITNNNKHNHNHHHHNGRQTSTPISSLPRRQVRDFGSNPYLPVS